MLRYYIIPNNVHYVEGSNIQSFQPTDKIEHDVPTAVLFLDSLATHFKRFVVVYKGKMQFQGGSGSCYNPTKKTFMRGENPMDNNIMPSHMSKWTSYNVNSLLSTACYIKAELLKKMGKDELIPHFMGYSDLYRRGLFGLLLGHLDMIGLGKTNIPIEVSQQSPRTQYLLSY